MLSVGGPGRIVSSDVNCGEGNDFCGAVVPHGTTVTLTPEAAADGHFAGWDGPCAGAGTGPCTLPIVNAFEIAAAFGHAFPSPGEQPLAVTLYGQSAHVTSQPSGIDCLPACSTSFESGTLVTLTMNSGSRVGRGMLGIRAALPTGRRFPDKCRRCDAPAAAPSVSTARDSTATTECRIPRRDRLGQGACHVPTGGSRVGERRIRVDVAGTSRTSEKRTSSMRSADEERTSLDGAATATGRNQRVASRFPPTARRPTR